MTFNKIEMAPKDQDAPYGKVIAWVNVDNDFIYQMQCFDRKDGRLLKTIMFTKVQFIKGVQIPSQTVVVNHKQGSKTVLTIKDLRVNTGLSDDVFSVKNLER